MELPHYMKWLPTSTTATLSRLEFKAKGAVDGFIAGRHKSMRKGASTEFAEHREYVPGDDLRRLDWRVLARKDRSYVKEYVDETNLRVTILLDASGSMAYAGDAAAPFEGHPLTKLEYAQYLAAVLSYLFEAQQDAVGLVVFDTKIREYLPAKARKSQIRAFLEQIDKTKAGDDTALAPVFAEIAERIPHRGLVIVLSDLFDQPEQIIKELHHFRFRHHEVVLFHLMADEELHFPFDSYTRFKDLESPAQLMVNPKAIRACYLERVNRFLGDIKTACGQMEVDYVPVNTKVPFDQALSQYLTHRKRT